jgi:hypothetical protein
MRVPLARSFALAGLLALGAVAQDGSPTCRSCLTHGQTTCGKHGRELAREQQPFVLHCSVATECRTCGGALQVDCKQCSNPAVENELTRRRDLAREWLQERRKAIDALTARVPFGHVKTTWFDLSSALAPATIGKEKLDGHARMHVHAQRLEELRTAFVRTLELSDQDVPKRCLVVMSEEAKDHNVLGPKLTGLGTASSVGLKLMVPDYVYSMWQDRRSLPDDEAVHRNLVHNVTHLLLSMMQPAAFLGRGYGWLDEGIAHWFEDKLTGKCTNFCFEEVLLLQTASFKGGVWRPVVRKLVDEGKAPAFAALAERNTDQLDYVEHAFAFAHVDHLLAVHGGAKLRDLLRLVKAGKPTREALATVYACNPITLDEMFQAWVKANYTPLPR